jgi:NhaA family Na+:H+ antiporter
MNAPTLPHGRLDAGLRLRVPVSATDRARGEGPLTLLIYADFECPDCQAFHRAFHRVAEAVRGQTRVVHRHFPLVSSRPRAMQSALALEAAGDQGAFWGMYDRLLAMERDRAPGELEKVAAELGLDVPRFRRDLRERRHADRIWAHMRSGRESGVTGTPSLFLDGISYRPVVGAAEIEADLAAWLAGAHATKAGRP